jgi:hypothetical protein
MLAGGPLTLTSEELSTGDKAERSDEGRHTQRFEFHPDARPPESGQVVHDDR